MPSLSSMHTLCAIPFSQVVITDGFWKHWQDLNRNVTIYAVFDRFQETGRFDALRCTWKEGEKNRPHIFWDSDVAKWKRSTMAAVCGVFALETFTAKLIPYHAFANRGETEMTVWIRHN